MNETEKDKTIFYRIGDYAKTNFVINWASGTLLFGCLTYSIIMYQENKNLKDTIEKQKENIVTLNKSVGVLETSVVVMQSTLEAFKANPPSVMDEKINGIYRLINVYHPNSNVTNTPPQFSSNHPESPINN